MRDQAELVGELVNMEKKVQYFNGQADKEHVRNALNAVAARRQGSEEAALAQDPFIAENIMANTALDSEDKLRIGRKANQMRQPQEYVGGAKEYSDQDILNEASIVANQSSASGFGQRGVVSPAMEPVVGAGKVPVSDQDRLCKVEEEILFLRSFHCRGGVRCRYGRREGS